MTLSRRGILGGLAGGVVAGPAAVKEMGNTMSARPPLSPYPSGIASSGGVAMNSISETVRRAYKAGIISKQQIWDEMFRDFYSGEIHWSLKENRSFSHAAKLRMSDDIHKERRFKSFISGDDDRGYMSRFASLMQDFA